MIKLLIGGSPCTYWSIAQKNNRETQAEGMGWELFKNYLVAKEKFKPDFFLYENNKSAAQAIKDQIKRELNVDDGTLLTLNGGGYYIEINSALVSAQNRQRFYVHNCGAVGQPEDRGILLKDILQSGLGGQRLQEKSRTLTAGYVACSQRDMRMDIETDGFMGKQGVIEPIRIPPYGQEDKARPLGALYSSHAGTGAGSLEKRLCSNNPNKQQVDLIAEPIRVGAMPTTDGELSSSQSARVYSVDGKSVTINAGGGGAGAKTGLYAVPILTGEYRYCNDKNMQHLLRPYGSKGKIVCDSTDKAPTLLAAMGAGGGNGVYYAENVGNIPKFERVCDCCIFRDTDNCKNCPLKDKNVYEVKDGQITIKSKQYPIKLPDGLYIIRKLTVTECCRLQTLPDDYCRAVSNAQAYKGLGNGWTAEVIIHILNGALKDVPKDEEIVVLSMYDGIGTGRYCLDKMGFTNVKYFAYEIDKYAMQVALSNYPDIIELGDAFQLRQDDWKLPNF